MIEVIKIVRPRMFLFENVRGITFGRWTSSSRKGQIWEDVQEAFQSIPGYTVPKGELLESGKYGVPQRRPRVMIVGIRSDCARLWLHDSKAPAEGLLPAPPPGCMAPDLQDVLGDLIDPNYLDHHATLTYLTEPSADIQSFFRRRSDGSIAGIGETVTEQPHSSSAAYSLGGGDRT
jgi:DNA (cytosine-5)-methyltransferase 1